ncbi:SDR family oxidoreductase [Microbacterium terricola]|uniref:Nucleoside-diphosphate sugar epimerase n=1 Tax=Microbacterium terricola TaxID=344163 RepID=A0ABM8E198_9MICO|nr:NAD(P)H-binding protein [Microbacterium terricola]UYK40547.1 NAD(P)H-binding protein [Microbacterium terricola]BDV31727.1 nucleoside-diphosphate sugar epimerase [Microbacterium terricola]
MRIAVAGGTGQAGAQAVAAATARGHEVVVLARSAGVDLVTGAGAAQSLDGVDAVIDASGVRKGDEPTAFHEAVTRTLAAARPAHLVVLSIVNCESAATYPLYAGKLAQERATEASGIPFTIARTTQFHEFSRQVLAIGKLGPLHFAPRMRTQPVAVREVGARLVDLAEAGAVGRAPDFAGPREESLPEMARAYVRAVGRRTPVFAISLGGDFGRAMRSGALLPGPHAEHGAQTFAEWIAALG